MCSYLFSLLCFVVGSVVGFALAQLPEPKTVKPTPKPKQSPTSTSLPNIVKPVETEQSKVEIPDTPLLAATKIDDVKQMKALMKSDPNWYEKDDGKCITVALLGNHLHALTLMLEKGASVNLKTANQLSMLGGAASFGYNEMVALLLKYGATDDTVDKNGNYALLYACKHCTVDTVKLLLDSGSNPNRINKANQTPMSTATTPIKQLLLTYNKGGPSWLARELSAQGLSWSVVCDVEAKLVKEGFVDTSTIRNIPLCDFTDAYLVSIGITGLAVRHIILDVRLRATWLGARLSTMSVNSANISVCEITIFDTYNCSRKEQFAALSPAIFRYLPGVVAPILLELQKQICDELRVATEVTTNSTTATNNNGNEKISDSVDHNCKSVAANSNTSDIKDSASSVDGDSVGSWEQL